MSLELAPFLATAVVGEHSDKAWVEENATLLRQSGTKSPTFCGSQRVLLAGLLAGAALILFSIRADVLGKRSHSSNGIKRTTDPSIAFCGNSMLYYNDCPVLVEILLQRMMLTDSTSTARPRITQESYIRGGANLDELWREPVDKRPLPFAEAQGVPSSVEDLFHHNESSSWKFVVLQDDVQAVIHRELHKASRQTLRDNYLPALDHGTVLLFLETFPPQEPRLRERTARMGDYNEYTDAIIRGTGHYAAMATARHRDARIVPLASAMRALWNASATSSSDLLWPDHMYHTDHIHPSPHTTWLQACLIVASMGIGTIPSWDKRLEEEWRQGARFWQEHIEPDEDDLPLPSPSEAEYLRLLAIDTVDL